MDKSKTESATKVASLNRQGKDQVHRSGSNAGEAPAASLSEVDRLATLTASISGRYLDKTLGSVDKDPCPLNTDTAQSNNHGGVRAKRMVSSVGATSKL